MSTKNILAYFSPKINTPAIVEAFKLAFDVPHSPNGDNPEAWLTSQIAHYTQQAAALESELKKTQVMLRGLQTWLADVERRNGGMQ